MATTGLPWLHAVLHLPAAARPRRVDHDGREGFTQEPPSCHNCDFGFMFELLEDYYPAQATGFVVCDQDARDPRERPRHLRADRLRRGAT